jgi:hypothetical protein
VKTPTIPVALFTVVLMHIAAPVLSAPPMGTIQRIDMTDVPHPRAYHPALGDIVEVYLPFAITPSTTVDSLDVAINGDSVSLAAVVNNPPKELFGAGRISAFLVPKGAGLSNVTLTASIAGKPGKPIEMAFLVEAQEPQATDAQTQAGISVGPGESCGGFVGALCDKGLVCKVFTGCEAPHTGTCVPVPELCPDLYQPVCGCDGETYNNECEALQAGVIVAYPGSCAVAR